MSLDILPGRGQFRLPHSSTMSYYVEMFNGNLKLASMIMCLMEDLQSIPGLGTPIAPVRGYECEFESSQTKKNKTIWKL